MVCWNSWVTHQARFLPLLALLAVLLLPFDSFAVISLGPSGETAPVFACRETCLNDPVNNIDKRGLEGGNVISAYGIPGLNVVYRNDFGYAQLATAEWQVQARAAKDSAKIGVAIGAGVLTGGAATELMIGAGLAQGSLALSVGAGMAAGIGSDVALQGTAIALGDQNRYDLKETVYSAGFGGVLGGGAKYAGDFIGFLGSKFKTPAIGPTIEAAEATPAGANLIGAGDRLAQASQWVKPQQGVFDVVVHGSEDSFHVLHNGSWVEIDQRSLATFIGKNGWNGEPVRLISCSSGASSTGVAQNLANKLGVEVTAPNNTVWIHPNGMLTVGPSATVNSGSWNVFTPGARH